jgi:hypothetical protein
LRREQEDRDSLEGSILSLTQAGVFEEQTRSDASDIEVFIASIRAALSSEEMPCEIAFAGEAFKLTGSANKWSLRRLDGQPMGTSYKAIRDKLAAAGGGAGDAQVMVFEAEAVAPSAAGAGAAPAPTPAAGADVHVKAPINRQGATRFNRAAKKLRDQWDSPQEDGYVFQDNTLVGVARSTGGVELSIAFGDDAAEAIEFDGATVDSAIEAIERYLRSRDEWTIDVVTEVRDDDFSTKEHGEFLNTDVGVLWKPSTAAPTTPAAATPKAAAASSSKPPAAASVAATASSGSKRPIAAATIVGQSESNDPLELADLAVANLDSVNSEQRAARFRELRDQFFKELDDQSTAIDLDDDDIRTKMSQVPARAMKQAREEIPENPRVSQLKAAKAKVVAAREAVTAAESELLALVQDINGSSSSSDSLPAKKAKK